MWNSEFQCFAFLCNVWLFVSPKNVYNQNFVYFIFFFVLLSSPVRWYSRIPDKKLFDNFENLFSSWNSCNLDAFLRDSYCKKKVPWHKLLVLGCSNRIIRTTCLTFKIKQVCVLPFDDREKTKNQVGNFKGQRNLGGGGEVFLEYYKVVREVVQTLLCKYSKCLLLLCFLR